MARSDLDRIVELWRNGAHVGELFAAIAATGAPDGAQDEARSGFVRFGRQDPATWASLVPLVVHAHAKFWEIDGAGDDPTTDSRGVVDTLLAGGFQGVVASEWGGSAWVDARRRGRVRDRRAAPTASGPSQPTDAGERAGVNFGSNTTVLAEDTRR